MELTIAVLVTAGWLLVFWYLYILVMGLYRAYLDKRLGKVTVWLAAPALVIGYVVDLVSNWTIASLIYWELPDSPLDLVTDRLSRHIKEKDGWRCRLSTWVCQNLLDFFDPTGRHCK